MRTSAQGVGVLVKVIDGLGLHVAAMQLRVSAKLLRKYGDEAKPIPTEVIQRCARARLVQIPGRY